MLNLVQKILFVAAVITCPMKVFSKDSIFVYTKDNKVFIQDSTKLYLALPGVHVNMTKEFHIHLGPEYFLMEVIPVNPKSI